MNTTTKVLEVDGVQRHFLLTPWVSRVFKQSNPLALFAAYNDDSISTVLELAYISYKEAVDSNGDQIGFQHEITEKAFFNIYASLDAEDKAELKTTLVKNFLDLDPQKTIMSELELLWDRADDEDKAKIRKFVLMPVTKKKEADSGKKSNSVGQKSNKLPLED